MGGRSFLQSARPIPLKLGKNLELYCIKNTYIVKQIIDWLILDILWFCVLISPGRVRCCTFLICSLKDKATSEGSLDLLSDSHTDLRKTVNFEKQPTWEDQCKVEVIIFSRIRQLCYEKRFITLVVSRTTRLDIPKYHSGINWHNLSNCPPAMVWCWFCHPQFFGVGSVKNNLHLPNLPTWYYNCQPDIHPRSSHLTLQFG